MKKVLLVLLLAVQSLLATEATAAPCVTASLASYRALGSGGCTIGNLLFSDFSFNGADGTTDFPGIELSPTGSGPDAGLNFTFTTGANEDFLRTFIHALDVTATKGKIYEDRIGFKVTGTTVSLNASTITLNGASTTGDGNVSTVQDLCLGGTFVDPAEPPACSSGTPSSQTVVFVTGVPDLTTSTTTFPPVMTLSVVNDIVVDAGTFGTAMLASLTSTFSSRPSAVPEPDVLLLVGAGLAALLMRRRSRRGRPTATA